jgi:hypothetical protein
MIITLTSDIEQALREQAQKKGTTPELLALESLREHFVAPVESPISGEDGATLVDFLSGHIGVIRSSEHVPGGARMSENSSSKFAAGMAEKRRRGHL